MRAVSFCRADVIAGWGTIQAADCMIADINRAPAGEQAAVSGEGAAQVTWRRWWMG